MKIQKIIMTICINLVLVSTSIAGPFGLEMGMSLKDIGDNTAKPLKKNGVYQVSVPKPHSAFDMYAVKISPKSGLCWIKAMGVNVKTNSYGVEIKHEYEKMQEKLVSVYGKTKSRDFLMSGSIWKEPNEWMMSLLKNERVLISTWQEVEGSSMPQDLKSVALMAQGLSMDTGCIVVEYSFNNKDLCDAELAAKEDGAL